MPSTNKCFKLHFDVFSNMKMDNLNQLRKCRRKTLNLRTISFFSPFIVVPLVRLFEIRWIVLHIVSPR